MSKAKTAEELRDEVLDHVRALAAYWAEHPDQRTVRERCDGLAFSILNIFDGTSGDLPAFDLVARPHPDDKSYHQERGEDWIEDGTVINDCMLHEMYYQKPNVELT